MIQSSVSSKIFGILEIFLFKYGETIFQNTAGIFLAIFMAFYGVKLVWDIAYKTTFKGTYSLEDILKPIAILSFLTLFLSTPYFVETWIVRPFYNLSVSLATLTATLTTDLPEHSSIGDMLQLVDFRLNQVVFTPCAAVSKLIGWTNMYLHIGIWILQGLYVFVWFLFLALMLEALFRFMTFFAISPLLITSLFFSQSKPIGVAGFRSLLHGILSMFMAGVAMGMTIAVIAVSKDLFILNGKVSANWVFSEQYFTLVLIALVSISFHLKAPKIAANLANIDDGPGAAAAVAGLGTAAVMSGKAMAGRMVGRSASGAAGGALSLGKKHGPTVAKAGWKALTSHGSSTLYGKMTGK